MLRNIQIQPVLNGYIVQAGCQTVVFDSRDKLLLAIADYTAKPEETEKRFLENAINRNKYYEQGPTTCCDATPQVAGFAGSPERLHR